MPVKIRLRRMGAKKQPSYRVVVADSQSPRGGAFIETIGHYNPLTKPATIKVDEDRVVYWVERGAQPTDAVVRLFKKINLTEKVPQLQAYERTASVAPASDAEQPAKMATAGTAEQPAKMATEERAEQPEEAEE
jgi:small subunit ribosomal protein S16